MKRSLRHLLEIIKGLSNPLRESLSSTKSLRRFHPNLVSVGKGSSVSKKSIMNGEIHLGDQVEFEAVATGKIEIASNSVIGLSTLNGPISVGRRTVIYKSSVRKYTYIAGDARILYASIGPFCSIANGVTVGLPQHPYHGISTSPVFFSNRGQCGVQWNRDLALEEMLPVEVGPDVWIGANVLIKGGVKIGTGSILGAGALVCKDVAPYSIVGGVPAKVIKMRFSRRIIRLLLRSRWWNAPEKKLQDEISNFADPEKFIKHLGMRSVK